MRRSLVSLVLLLSFGCGASVQSSASVSMTPLSAHREFSEVDHDRDDRVSATEFLHATSTYVGEFDGNQDGQVDRDELAHGFFRAFDQNGTGRIDEGELRRGAMRWWPASVELRYQSWNTHPDGGLDEDELHAATERVGVMRQWDRDHDGAVTHAEVSSALFASWDLDDDESIDPFEWRWD